MLKGRLGLDSAKVPYAFRAAKCVAERPGTSIERTTRRLVGLALAHERVWAILESWWAALQRGGIVIVWRDKKASGNVRIETIGEPSKEIVDADGVLLLKRH